MTKEGYITEGTMERGQHHSPRRIKPGLSHASCVWQQHSAQCPEHPTPQTMELSPHASQHLIQNPHVDRRA